MDFGGIHAIFFFLELGARSPFLESLPDPNGLVFYGWPHVLFLTCFIFLFSSFTFRIGTCPWRLYPVPMPFFFFFCQYCAYSIYLFKIGILDFKDSSPMGFIGFWIWWPNDDPNLSMFKSFLVVIIKITVSDWYTHCRLFAHFHEYVNRRLSLHWTCLNIDTVVKLSSL